MNDKDPPRKTGRPRAEKGLMLAHGVVLKRSKRGARIWPPKPKPKRQH